jgi:hypothetical protein
MEFATLGGKKIVNGSPSKHGTSKAGMVNG